MENHEKVLLLVYFAAFKGVTGLLTTLLEGDALRITSDGFIIHQIDRALASPEQDFADRRVSGFKIVSAVHTRNTPLSVKREINPRQ